MMTDPELIDMLDEKQLRHELKELVKKYVAQTAENSILREGIDNALTYSGDDPKSHIRDALFKLEAAASTQQNHEV